MYSDPRRKNLASRFLKRRLIFAIDMRIHVNEIEDNIFVNFCMLVLLDLSSVPR